MITKTKIRNLRNLIGRQLKGVDEISTFHSIVENSLFNSPLDCSYDKNLTFDVLHLKIAKKL